MRRPRVLDALLSPFPDLDAIHGPARDGWPVRFHLLRWRRNR
jgi:hypothetical protein